VASVGTTWLKTENSGFCAQIVFTVDLLSFSRMNKMRRIRSEGHVRDPRNTRVGETSRRQRRMKASSEEDKGPEGAVMSWMDGWMDVWIILRKTRVLKAINLLCICNVVSKYNWVY
jgi:hypothetical protein